MTTRFDMPPVNDYYSPQINYINPPEIYWVTLSSNAPLPVRNFPTVQPVEVERFQKLSYIQEEHFDFETRQLHTRVPKNLQEELLQSKIRPKKWELFKKRMLSGIPRKGDVYQRCAGCRVKRWSDAEWEALDPEDLCSSRSCQSHYVCSHQCSMLLNEMCGLCF